MQEILGELWHSHTDNVITRELYHTKLLLSEVSNNILAIRTVPGHSLPSGESEQTMVEIEATE
jgi:hypothetical protein